MSDFEKRLSDALMSGADDAPGADGLAMAARSRSRRRRRTTMAAGAAAVVAAAVPVGVIALNGGGSDPVDTATDDTRVASDTRIETWHDVSVEVPASWGHGGRGAWCTGGEVTDAVVERPGTVTPMIACDPAMSYGVTFGSTATTDLAQPSGTVVQYQAGDVAMYEPESWIGYWYEGDDLVQVNAADEETVQAIIDSVERVDGVDGNGCPVVDEGRVGEPVGDDVSVCRYSAVGALQQSERLTGDDAEAARAAVAAAPDLGAANDCANPPGEYVVMTLGSERADVQYTGMACSDRGLSVGVPPPANGTSESSVDLLQLTEDVMYWALSPGWMWAVESWVPMPDQLRELPAAETTAQPTNETTCPDGYFANSDFALDPDNGAVMTVCRMELSYEGESGGTHLLADVTELTLGQSDAVRAAVEAAPVMENSDFKQCNEGPGEFLLVLAGDAVPLWVYNGQCGELTAMTTDGDGVVHHKVTPELLEALESPHGLLR